MQNPDKLFGRLGNRLFQMAFIYAQMKKGTVKDIYCQDFMLFDEYKEEIKRWFGDEIGYLPYVAIHLRRGDYVDNSFYVNLSATGYYIDATNLFPNRKFLVFSDDILFARTYFEGDKFAFDESENDLDSFNRFASCDSHIIANSSWSAWAAYLSPSVSKKIVAPNTEKWYFDKDELRTVLPKEWKRI